MPILLLRPLPLAALYNSRICAPIRRYFGLICRHSSTGLFAAEDLADVVLWRNSCWLALSPTFLLLSPRAAAWKNRRVQASGRTSERAREKHARTHTPRARRTRASFRGGDSPSTNKSSSMSICLAVGQRIFFNEKTANLLHKNKYTGRDFDTQLPLLYQAIHCYRPRPAYIE